MNLGSFSSFFENMITDNNGVAVSDINAGIQKLYDNVILPADNSDYSMFVVTDEDQGMPDLIAHKYYGDQNLWYYFLLSNGLEDPFKEIDVGWAYGIVDTAESETSVEIAEESTLVTQSRIGSTITLN